jgi:pseudouridine synthase
MDLIPTKYRKAGGFPVGRLDKAPEGLQLLTNDGDLAQRLCRPESHVIKSYHVEIDRPLDEADRIRIEKGLFIHQIRVKTRPVTLKALGTSGKSLIINLQEGKKRQIRYTFKNLNYAVTYLKRIAYGPLDLKGLNRGAHRLLKTGELKQLRALAGVG